MAPSAPMESAKVAPPRQNKWVKRQSVGVLALWQTVRSAELNRAAVSGRITDWTRKQKSGPPGDGFTQLSMLCTSVTGQRGWPIDKLGRGMRISSNWKRAVWRAGMDSVRSVLQLVMWLGRSTALGAAVEGKRFELRSKEKKAVRQTAQKVRRTIRGSTWRFWRIAKRSTGDIGRRLLGSSWLGPFGT